MLFVFQIIAGVVFGARQTWIQVAEAKWRS